MDKIIKIVDARMGRGKSTAAMRFMNENKEHNRFLYITPFLDEVDRICHICDFDQPESDRETKTSQLMGYLASGESVAATHALFYLMTDEMLELVNTYGYTLIADECLDAVSKISISPHDFKLLLSELADVNVDGQVRWRDSMYEGRFSGYKDIADSGSLFVQDAALIHILNPNLIRSFKDVYMLTYLFEGQPLNAYLDYFGFNYDIIGIEEDELGFKFSDCPDNPPRTNLKALVNIVDSKKMNMVGNGRTTLSATWYKNHGKNSDEINTLRRNMHNFFHNMTCGNADTRLWTCFKTQSEKLVGAKGRYRNNFLHLNARATNAYRECTDLAYMINRFADPNLSKFFAQRNAYIDQDRYALSEMLQWVWRSAIRDDKPINLYLPSRRMRSLLENWLEGVS